MLFRAPAIHYSIRRQPVLAPVGARRHPSDFLRLTETKRIEWHMGKDSGALKEDLSAPAISRLPKTSPMPSEVWEELRKIGDSASLRRAERLVQLLGFLVETTLRGEAQYLKETTIGLAVFGRPPDYDPKADAIVRSQVWRLRARLDDYYATEGSDDPVIISIPKGRYETIFSLRRAEDQDSSPKVRLKGRR